MAETVAEVVLLGVGAYTLAGVIFALAFVTRGVSRVDPAAAGAGVLFRALILPGTALLWPWLLVRWRRAGRTP